MPAAETSRRRVLFLCTGNSCRSQMAEGLCQHHLGDRIEARSAGLEKRGLDPRAIVVMREIGIDIALQQSKTVAELAGATFDCVVTVCGHAEETCPVFPARTQRIHRGFEDPPRLAATARDDEEALAHYRRIRDEIERFVLALPAELDPLGH